MSYPQITRDNGTHLFVTLYLIDLPDVAQVGASPTVDANTAYDLIANATDDNRATPFAIQVNNNTVITPLFFQPGSRQRGTGADDCPTPPPRPPTTDPPCPDNNITSRLGLSDGIVAGIAIGLFFLGLFVGLLFVLFCYVFCKCMDRSGSMNVTNVKYKKHDDELEAI